MRSEDEQFTVILPTLNERQNISPLLDRLSSLHPEACVLVVDDCSDDGTAEEVRRRMASNHRLDLLERSGASRGLSGSVTDGILRVRTEFFIVIDADFQHPPERIADMMESLIEGNDIVVGVRQNRRSLSASRKLSSMGAHAMANAYLLIKGQPRTRDTMSGFFGGRTQLWREIIEESGDQFESQGFKVLFDLLRFAPRDISIGQVEFEFGERRGGESKLSSRVALSIMKQCGMPGKAVALVISFLFLNMLGRFLATLILGTVSTFALVSFLGSPFHISALFPTITSLIVAMVYLVIATELLFRRRNDSLLGSARLIMVATVGYLFTIFMFYLVTPNLEMLQALCVFVGFGVALSWDVIGCTLPTS